MSNEIDAQLLEQAKDPNTPPLVLQELARDPRLWPALAENPNLYPELLEWLRAKPDPQLQAALARRDGKELGSQNPQAENAIETPETPEVVGEAEPEITPEITHEIADEAEIEEQYTEVIEVPELEFFAAQQEELAQEELAQEEHVQQHPQETPAEEKTSQDVNPQEGSVKEENPEAAQYADQSAEQASESTPIQINRVPIFPENTEPNYLKPSNQYASEIQYSQPQYSQDNRYSQDSHYQQNNSYAQYAQTYTSPQVNAPDLAAPQVNVQSLNEEKRSQSMPNWVWALIGFLITIVVVLTFIVGLFLTSKPSVDTDPKEPTTQSTETVPTKENNNEENPRAKETPEEKEKEILYPAPADALKARALITKSGNMSCLISEEEVSCLLQGHDEGLGSCPADKPLEITQKVGKLSIRCKADPSKYADKGSVNVNYGQTITYGEYACTSKIDRTTCWNLSSGKGFDIARQLASPIQMEPDSNRNESSKRQS